MNFDIEKRPLTGAAITLEAGPFKQTGSAIEPAVTGVVVGGITVPAAAYDVSYQNNINAGAATVTVTAKAGGNFSDKASMTFDSTALKAILAAVPSTARNITFTAAPADLSAFPDAGNVRHRPGTAGRHKPGQLPDTQLHRCES